MTRTTDDLRFATRRFMERHRCIRWQPMAGPGPLTRRIALVHPEPAPDRRPAWMARLKAKELVR